MSDKENPDGRVTISVEQLQIVVVGDGHGNWHAQIHTNDFRDRVPDLKLDPFDPARKSPAYLSPLFEAETRGAAESQALRWLAAELFFSGR